MLRTNVSGLKLRARGKVRDIYEDDARLLIVATDRISAFDYILATGIPDKGRVLTQMTLFWLDLLRATVPNHLLSTDTSGLPDELEGRSMWVRRAEMIDIECVARGYLSGSGWKEYQHTGAVCGIPLPKGLREKRCVARAYLHARYQGPIWPRRKHFVRGGLRAHRPRPDYTVARSDSPDLPPSGRLRAPTRHHHRRYKIRVWSDSERNHPGGRSPHARLFAVLAVGSICTGWPAALLR